MRVKLYVIEYIIGNSVFCEYAFSKPSREYIIKGIEDLFNKIGFAPKVKVNVRPVEVEITISDKDLA